MRWKIGWRRSLALLLVLLLLLSVPVATGAENAPAEEQSLTLQASAQRAMANQTGELTLAELQSAELLAEDVPEVLEIDRTSRNRPVNRLQEQEEALNLLLFQNRDGTRSMFYYGQDIKYQDENGRVWDKSNRLTNPDPADERGEGYAYTNRQNNIRSFFPEELSPQKGILVTNGKYSLEMRPERSSEKLSLAAGLRPTQQRMTPQIRAATAADAELVTTPLAEGRAADTVNYEEVFGEGTIVRYAATFNGVKEDIVLLQRPTMNRFSFMIRTNGLRMTLEDGVGCLVDPADGEEHAFVSPLTILDGNGTDKTAGYAHGVELEPITENEVYRYTIVVDPAFLDAPETVYPVTIDPSVNYQNFAGSTFIKVTQLRKRGSTYSREEDVRMVAVGYNLSDTGRALITFPDMTSLTVYQNISHAVDCRLFVCEASPSNDEQVIECHTNTVDATSSVQSIWNAVSDSTWQGDTGFCHGWGYANSNGTGSGDWYGFTMGPTFESWCRDHSQAEKGIVLKQFDEEDDHWNMVRLLYTPKAGNDLMVLRLNYQTYGDLGWSYVLPASHRTLTQRYHSQHLGVDIADSSIDGQPIYSPTNGVVDDIITTSKNSGAFRSMGYAVIIRTDMTDVWGPIIIRFLHMKSPPVVQQGQQVSAGTLLGYVGNTGDSYGSHLHLDMNNLGEWDGGKIRQNPERTIDPVLFFPNI